MCQERAVLENERSINKKYLQQYLQLAITHECQFLPKLHLHES